MLTCFASSGLSSLACYLPFVFCFLDLSFLPFSFLAIFLPAIRLSFFQLVSFHLRFLCPSFFPSFLVSLAVSSLVYPIPFYAAFPCVFLSSIVYLPC